MAFLKVQSGTEKGRRFEIDRDRVVIGRSSENAIVLADPSISGKHCEILRDGRVFTVRDLGSTNGTRLNGVAVAEYRLSPKDALTVGSVEMQFDGEDVDPYVASGDRMGDTQVTIRVPADSLRVAQAPPAFGAKRSRRWIWIVTIAMVAACAGAALALFLYRMFAG